jgi:hypothetical protein
MSYSPVPSLGLTWTDIVNGPPELQRLIEQKIVTPQKGPQGTSPTAADFTSDCTLKLGEYTRLAAAIQGALFSRGQTQIKLNGIWSQECCDAWWKHTGKPLSEDAIRDLLGNQQIELCTMVVTERCIPTGSHVVDPTQPAPPGGKSSDTMLWVIGGLALAATLWRLSK